MKIIPFIYKDIDDLCANTYVLIDNSNNCVVIDPSKEYDGLVNYIKKNELNIKAVLLTHSHCDHFRGAELLIKTFNIPLYIGFYDAPGLKDPILNCSIMLGQNKTLNIEPITISEGQTISVLDEEIYVIDTPYHTCGSVCYYLKESKALFSGDSLFCRGVGRSDLPTSVRKMQSSSLKKILSLPEDVKVFCGHGPNTSIEIEKKFSNYHIF